ncbi:MAG: RNA polymerase sigma factor [Streptosporangiaceae bacterium]
MSHEQRRERFEAAFRDHYGDVLAYALARADPEMAKDAAAAAFLVAWRRRDDLPEQPRAWLLGVTRKILADQRRARDRRTSLARKLAAHPQAAENAPDPGEEVSARATVLAALGTLRPADQELLRLVAWEGLTNAEIAVVLGCPRRLIAVRLHRARQRFRAALEAHDQASPANREDFPIRTPDPITLEDR